KNKVLQFRIKYQLCQYSGAVKEQQKFFHSPFLEGKSIPKIAIFLVDKILPKLIYKSIQQAEPCKSALGRTF
ncbi:MAG: hypothetical protein KHX36_10675, partial [Clostridiales bacterium]|nr:hypothetical protein [Clostridiales bacterium]